MNVGGKAIRESSKARFWANIAPVNDCWEWTRSKNRQGYGVVGVNGKNLLAHRFAFLLTHGSIPEGMMVLHRCDNPMCVKPDHLFVGTHIDNMKDMTLKGRGYDHRG